MINQDLSKTISKSEELGLPATKKDNTITPTVPGIYKTEGGREFKEVNIESLNEGDEAYLITINKDGWITDIESCSVADPGEHLLSFEIGYKYRCYWNGPEQLSFGTVRRLAVKVPAKKKDKMKDLSKTEVSYIRVDNPGPDNTTITITEVEELVLPATKEDLLDQLTEYDDDIEELLLAIESFKDTQIGYRKLVDNWGIEAKDLDLKKVLEEIIPQTLEFGNMIISNMNKYLLDSEAALGLSEKDSMIAWDVFYDANNKLIALRALARELK